MNSGVASAEVFVSLTMIRIGNNARPSAAATSGAPGGVSKELLIALHIALASYGRMEYLVTWNCTHIANAEIRKAIEVVARRYNVNCPIICTPQELMGLGKGKR